MKPAYAFTLGFFIGLIASFLGCFLFMTLFTDYSFWEGMKHLHFENKLGKIITIGTILDLFVFWALLRYNQEFMAKGVILAVIVLTLFTLFV